MEFTPRGDHRASAPSPHPANSPVSAHQHKHIDWQGRAIRIEWFVFTLLVAIVLLIAIGWLIFSGSASTASGEAKLVKSNKYQAVFLNGGATSGAVAYTTYFGHITKLNGGYVVLNDVYYLTTASSSNSSQSSSPQLTKLGCQQLHSPDDQMVINRSQVAFWENLQNSGKVVQAIQQFQKQNPNGPNCNASTSNNTPTSTQNSTTPTGTSNGSTKP